jgi:diguanylate cyclase (GGDEF)-like protein
MLLAGVIVVAGSALVVAAVGVGPARRLEKERGIARRRLAEIASDGPAEDADTAAHASALRPDVRLETEARAVLHDNALLRSFLGYYRDVVGAEEAVFWRWNPERDTLVPALWSHDGPRPKHFAMAEWGSLVQWSAETRVVQTMGQGEMVLVGAACVQSGEVLLGALSLTHRKGIQLERPALREWLPRFAGQLAIFHDLVEVRRRFGRQKRQGEALLDAVQRLQGDMSGQGLARALCETAVEVSGARGAALVRWDPESETGEVHFATTLVGVAAGAALEPSSMVAAACRRGEIEVHEDARTADATRGLFGVDRTVAAAGSVAILPLKKESRVIGAVVLEAAAPGALTLEDMRPLTVLGAVASGSLELAWSYAEVDRRARTDALTGLFNRMHFGEQLQRTLAEADRFGQPVSLVLVDVDHFKKVNDTWGHEAGDAVLKQVARLVQEGVRQVDVCVRYGGEEIAMLLSQTDSARAVEVAERLRGRIASTIVRHGGAEIAVTASFGVATYPETVNVRDQLFPSADKALYIAKHDGRNCVRFKPPTRGKTPS